MLLLSSGGSILVLLFKLLLDISGGIKSGFIILFMLGGSLSLLLTGLLVGLSIRLSLLYLGLISFNRLFSFLNILIELLKLLIPLLNLRFDLLPLLAFDLLL